MGNDGGGGLVLCRQRQRGAAETLARGGEGRPAVTGGCFAAQRLSGGVWRDVPRVGAAEGDAVALEERWIAAAPFGGSKFGLGTVRVEGGGFTMRDSTYRCVVA
jgi:hypothetical protein